MLQFVSDWGGFEKLIAKLHETGTVKVDHNVVLTGKSGAPRQIDVLVTHTEGLYTHRILVECKHWKHSVKRAQVDAMVTAIDDLNASKGVFFTTKGYQSGAETMAKNAGIDIFVVRDITDEEWGAPGRVVQFTLHVVWRAIGPVELPDAKLLIPRPLLADALHELKLAVSAGPDGFDSNTPVFVNGKNDTLERILDFASMHVVNRMTSSNVTFNKLADCTVHMMSAVEVPFDPPMQIPQGSGFVICPMLRFDVGLKISQSQIRVDRSENYLFALALEDCVTGSVYAASRARDAPVSELRQLDPKGSVSDDPDAFKNGSLMRVVMKPFFDFDELRGKTPVDVPFGLIPPVGFSSPSPSG